ncbi:hypothetical protein B7463_g877, partial [Scytalidium lignicola]
MRTEAQPNLGGPFVPHLEGNHFTEDTNPSIFQNYMSDNQYLPQQDEFAPNPVIGLGLFEQLPPWPVIEDLTDLYFSKVHQNAPMLHRTRYITSLHLPAHMSPPMSLQYAVMALAATISDKYTHFAMPFYQRARNYADSDETRDYGEHFVTLANAQCWVLLSQFEAYQLWFSRVSMSISRSVRLAQMLNLHWLDPADNLSHAPQPTIPPPKDWSELEERRRTFWIRTLLPASEDAFQKGIEEKTCSMTEALKPNGPNYSSLAGKVLALYLFQTNLDHSFNSQPDDNPEDIKNGAYWKRHREMDNALSTMSMLLPETLKMPRAFRDHNAVFVNINLYSSIICLHRAAIAKVKQHNLPQEFLQRSKSRLLPAAEEILSVLRMSGNMIAMFKDPFVSFGSFMAASVFIEDFSDMKNHQSEDNLNFLLTAMAAAAKVSAITKSLTVQLALHMKRSGVDLLAMDKIKDLKPENVPLPLLGRHDTTTGYTSLCPILPHYETELSSNIQDDSPNDFLSQSQFTANPQFDLTYQPANNSLNVGTTNQPGRGSGTLNEMLSDELDLYSEGRIQLYRIMMKAIIITGATGKQGGSVVKALLNKNAGFEILAVTRNAKSQSAQKLLQKSPKIKLLEGNLDNPASLFQNARRVTSLPIWGVFSVQAAIGPGQSGEREEPQGKSLIDESIQAGVKCFVYSSVDRGGANSINNPTDIPHFKSKYNIEHHLINKTKNGEMDWTILRPVAFCDNFVPGFGTRVFATSWKMTLGNNKPLQLVAVDDIGYFAAEAFLNPEEFKGKSISLAGDELTFDQMARTFKEKTGRDVPMTFRFICSLLMMRIKEFGTMFRWFAKEGYAADIPELKKIHPGLKNFGTWLEKDSPFLKN